MNEANYTITETDLASRHSAAGLRTRIVSRVQAGDRAVIDFAAVLSISESYADELFGVLAAHYGLDWLTNHVAVKGVRPVVFRVIANAIRYRLQSQKPTQPDIALLTARGVLEKRRRSSSALSGK